MRNRTKYVQMPAKAFVKLEKKFKTECCDCGLVHVWVLTKRKGTFGFNIERDNRATGQRRRNTTMKKPKAKNLELSKTNVRYLIKRLETVIQLLNDGEKHMAIAKLLADISALKGYR